MLVLSADKDDQSATPNTPADGQTIIGIDQKTDNGTTLTEKMSVTYRVKEEINEDDNATEGILKTNAKRRWLKAQPFVISAAVIACLITMGLVLGMVFMRTHSTKELWN